MGVKYVKDFSFPSSGGFHGDVQRYAKGGHVTKVPAKAKASAKDVPARAKPNAPAKGAPKMESKPAKGKRQGYNEGGRVPGYEMDRLPTKRPPGRGMDLAPARPFKGKYEGYAEGGPVAEILPGDGRGGLDAVPAAPMYDAPMGMRGREFEKVDFDPGNRNRDLLRRMQEPPRPPVNPVTGESGDMPPDDFLRNLMQRDTERMRGDAAQQMRDISALEAAPPMQLGGDQYPIGTPVPVRATTPLPEEPQYDIPPELRGPPKIVPASRAQRPIAAADRMAARRAAVEGRAGMRQDTRRAPAMSPRNMLSMLLRALSSRSKAPTPRMKSPAPVSRMRSEVLPANPAALPVFKKGGEVKGKKIGKIMGEYKRGELHSGSKKGPKVTSEKQAMAIALSEARKAGAKIPKKAEGGIFNNEDMAYESKGPKTRYSAARSRRESKERAMERRALDKARHAEKYAPGMSLDMPDKKKHGGMPVHRRKPMYGGGKC